MKRIKAQNVFRDGSREMFIESRIICHLSFAISHWLIWNTQVTFPMSQ